MTKKEIKQYRDKLILNEFNRGVKPEELAYMFNISARRISDILKTKGITVKIDNKLAEELKSSRSPVAKQF